jgi:protein O-GlcNAc transferase
MNADLGLTGVATVAEMFAVALQFHQSGQLRQAEQLYRQILQADPAHADAHHLLGVFAYQVGEFDQAVAAIGKAVTLNPHVAAYFSNLGAAHEAMGHKQDAGESYLQALRLDPANAEAHHNVGNLLFIQGRPEEAISHFQSALRSKPDYAEAQLGLANSLFRQGKLDQALDHYQLALRCRPNYPEAENGIGNVLLTLGRIEDAVVHYRDALRWRPDYPEALNGLGNTLLEQGKVDEAVAHYRQALQSRPDYPEAHNGLGNALGRQDKIEEAIQSCRQALRLKPDLAEAYYNLGNALEQRDELEEVIRCYSHALQFKPNFAEAHNNLGSILLRLGEVVRALASFREALRLKPQLQTAQSNLLFALNYDPGADLDRVFQEHRIWGEAKSDARCPMSEVEDIVQVGRTGEGIRDGKRLRIGYVSPDLRYHPLTRYLEPVLTHHDRQLLEVYCFAEVPRPDAVTRRLQNLVQGWRWTCGKTDTEVADQIRRDQIDILVDLAGHTAGNRLTVFALKPAPVQVTWLGYLNTTGLKQIDYRLTDEVLDPSGVRCPESGVKTDFSDSGLRTPDPGHSLDTEDLYRLPGGMCCFAPPADAPEVAELPCLGRGFVTFGSLNSLFKLNVSVFDLWSDVLKAVPRSRLLLYHHTLIGSAMERIRGEFTSRGIASERLDLRRGSHGPSYLRVYDEIDISLDTLPYSGGVTTCESLWMGVPVVSLCGVRPAGRNSAAILIRAGLSDWVVSTTEEYVAVAIQKGKIPNQLAALRMQLREQVRAKLCDAERFTRELEAAFQNMWQMKMAVDRPRLERR